MLPESEASIRRLCTASERAAQDRFASVRSRSLDEADREALRPLPTWDPIATSEPFRDAGYDTDVPVGRWRTDAYFNAGTDLESMLTRGLNHMLDRLPHDHPARRYILTEIYEEAEHSAMFTWFCSLPGGSRMRMTTIESTEIDRVSDIAISDPAVFLLYTVFGEMYFDRVQRAALETPESPELIRTINRIHRQDEARHISFARIYLADLMREASSKTMRRMAYQAPMLARWTSERILGVPPVMYRELGFDDDAVASCTKAVRSSVLHKTCAQRAQRLCRDLGLDDPRLERSWRTTIEGEYDVLPI